MANSWPVQHLRLAVRTGCSLCCIASVVTWGPEEIEDEKPFVKQWQNWYERIHFESLLIEIARYD